MRIYSVILLITLSLNLAHAASELSRIVDIDYPDTMTDDVLIFLSSGKVVKLSQDKQHWLSDLQKSQMTKDWLRLDTDHLRYIARIIKVERPYGSSIKSFHDGTAKTYVLSTLKNLDWAKKYFSEAKRNPKESQCYNRAHVWSYEWYKRYKFNSSKVFLFFTRKFIRERNFSWWFHVAPSVLVNINGGARERVMDMKYTSGPLMVKDWIKRFIKIENPGCLSVNTYSDYANFPENGNCYIMKTSMYYYWPLDLENEELYGTIKDSWIDEEVKTAYLEAFALHKKCSFHSWPCLRKKPAASEKWTFRKT